MKKSYKYLMVFSILLGLSSCGTSYKTETADTKQSLETKDESQNPSIDNPSEGAEDINHDLDNPDAYIEKIVNMMIDTTNYEKDLASIKDSSQDLKGYIENESTYIDRDDYRKDLKNTDLTIKIPRENSEKFQKTLDGIGKLSNIQKNANNLEKSFRDVDTEIGIKNKELDKFNELLEKSDNIQDTLVINSKIIETQSYIDALKKSR